MKKLLFVGVLACACTRTFASASSDLGYVDTGLIAHWDAIDNQATGSHSDSAASWIDLVGGEEFALTGVEWNYNSVHFAGNSSSYGHSTADTMLAIFATAGTNRTVEIACKYDAEKSHGMLLYAQTASGIAIGRWKENATTQRMIYCDKSAPTGRPAPTDAFFVTSVGYYNKLSLAANIYHDGVAATNPGNNYWNQGTAGDVYLGRPSGSGDYYGALRIYSIRVYDRLLTADEVASNLAVDQARFVNVSAGEVLSGSVTVGGTTYAGRYVPVAAGTTSLAIDTASDAVLKLADDISDLEITTGTVTFDGVSEVRLANLTLGFGAVLGLPPAGVLVSETLTADSSSNLRGPGWLSNSAAAFPGILVDDARYICSTWMGWPSSGEAVIPPGVTATIGADDVAKLTTIEKIVFLDGTGKAEYALSDPISFSTPLEGAGEMRFVSAGDVTLAGDNRNFAGNFYFTNTSCLVTGEYALGGPSTRAAEFHYVKNKNLTFDNGTAVMTNYAPILIHHPCATLVPNTENWSFGSESLEKTLVQAADFTVDRKCICSTQHHLTPTFKNNVTFLGDVRFSKTGGHSSSYLYPIGTTKNGTLGKVRFLGKFTATGWSNWYASGGGEFYFAQPLAIGSVYIRAYTAWNVVAGCEHIYGTISKWCRQQSGSTLDLGGYDQNIKEMDGYGTATTVDYNIKSTEPAQLIYTGNSARTGNTHFSGAAGFTKRGTGAHTLAKTECDTVGTLRVENGSLELLDDYSWKGTNVVVTGGELIVNSARAFPTGKASLEVTGGKLTVKSGAVAMFNSAKFGSGDGAVALADGTYTMAALKATDGVSAYIGNAADDAATITVDSSAEEEWAGWPAEGGSVTIPKNVTVTVTAADLARVALVTDLSIGNNARLVYSGLDAETLEVGYPITGTGSVEFENCSGTVVITSDNSGLVAPGAFKFTLTDVVVSNRFGLGGVDTGTCQVYNRTGASDGARKRLVFGGPATTNDVPVTIDLIAYFGYSDYTFGGFCQNGAFTQTEGLNGQQDKRLLFISSITFTKPVQICYADCTHNNLEYNFIEDGILMGGGGTKQSAWYGNYETFRFGNANPPETIQSAVFQTCSDFYCGADGVFDLKYCLGIYAGVEANPGTVHLEGHDQHLGGLTYYSGGDLSSAPLVFTSETPATICITNRQDSNGHPQTYSRCAKFDGDVSLEYYALQANCNQIIGRCTGDTKGHLKVDGAYAGYLAFTNGSYWAGTDVSIGGRATLKIGADCAINTAGEGAFFNRKTNLVMDNTQSGDRLDIAAGRTESVRTLFVIDGEHPEGYYAARGDYVYGAGVLRVRFSSPNPGLIMIVK